MEQFELPRLEGFTWPEPVYLYRPAGAESWGPREEATAAAAITPPRELYCALRSLVGGARAAGGGVSGDSESILFMPWPTIVAGRGLFEVNFVKECSYVREQRERD